MLPLVPVKPPWCIPPVMRLQASRRMVLLQVPEFLGWEAANQSLPPSSRVQAVRGCSIITSRVKFNPSLARFWLRGVLPTPPGTDDRRHQEIKQQKECSAIKPTSAGFGNVPVQKKWEEKRNHGNRRHTPYPGPCVGRQSCCR